MTDFIFENEAQIRKFGERYFMGGRNIKNVTRRNTMFFIYLISYRACSGEKINSKALESFKEKAKEKDESIKLRIFFDKVESCRDDYLYFQNVIKEIEKRRIFHEVYDRYVEVAA